MAPNRTGSVVGMVLRWSGRNGRSVGRLRLPGGAVFDQPIVLSRLMARYLLTGLIALVIIAVFTAWASRSLGVRTSIDNANRRATLTGHAAVEPMLDDGLLTGNPASIQKVDSIVRSQVLRGSLIRVKIWSPQGKILYSDEGRLIGETFEMQASEQEALTTGQTQAELSDLSEPENRYEEPAAQLLEVYLPVKTQQGSTLLFEAYFRYSGITEAGRQLWLRFAPFSLGALVLLELLQVPLVLSLARRLRRTQYQREDLLRNALEATQEERRRIAGDLHDGVVQDLAGVAFSLSAAARQPGRPAGDAESVREAADRVRDGVRSLRSLLVEIYPPNLYDEGLEAALSDLLARLEPRGIETSLRVDAPVDTLDLDAVQLIYRAAQEGVRNVVAHADAARVTIAVFTVRDTVVLEVSDDGRGLPGPDLPQRPGHLGLRALGGLAATMGASLTLSSTPGKGTVLALEMPTP
jgi:two-component system NarL family sensor kinase